jgi:hypothetical protein
MKRKSNGHSRSLIAVVAVSSLLFTACHFDSDKDYKSEEGRESADSTHKNAHADDQHNPSKPPVDAARPGNSSLNSHSDSAVNGHGDSAVNRTPVTGNDSSIKKDSSKGH